VDYKDWEKLYVRILKDYNFSRKEDERSALLLSKLLAEKKVTALAPLRKKLSGKVVTVVGGQLKKAGKWLDRNPVPHRPVICCDSATNLMLRRGIIPDIVVTDLDGDVNALVNASRNGAILVVHAHGDNITAVQKTVPLLPGTIIGTTQGRPRRNVRNFGGFTDGDRAVFLAHHFCVKTIILVGFDFRAPYGETGKKAKIMKLNKLRTAKMLIGLIKRKGARIIQG
jgi:uncharacterized Rossmann fold enzyme